jgi:membrane protein YdbS with pleckstrin-like domain
LVPARALTPPLGSPEGLVVGFPSAGQFQPDEAILVATRRHPVVLVGPILLVVTPWLLRSWVLHQTAVSELGGDILVVLAAVGSGIGAGQLLNWVHGWFIVTQGRVLLFSGVLGQNKAVMPVQRVTDVATTRPIPRSLLGYCHVMIESAGQDQALHTVRYLARPGRVCQVMDYITNRPLQPVAATAPGVPEALADEAPETAVPGQFLLLGILVVLVIAVAQVLN